MEVSGTVLRHVTHVSGAAQYRGRVVVPRGGVRVRRTVMGCGFCDEGHVQYYQDRKSQQPVLTSKKKLKLLKGLSKGASSSFPQLGFALDNLQGNLNTDVGEVEVLLRELEKLRAEKKELKKRKKQEKKAKLKASRMKTVPDCKSESSSSSSSSESESSDSECDKVVDMNTFRADVGVELLQPPPPASQSTMLSPPTTVDADAMKLCSRNDDVSVGSVSVGFKNESNVIATAPQKRIEVCMGNKCKKSGSAALLQEFERVMVGVEGGAVVGCKCMGKCKSAPNVRIQSSSLDHGLAEGLNDSVKVPVNPLCIGVGLEDVNTIVARFLGEENHTDMGMAAATT